MEQIHCSRMGFPRKVRFKLDLWQPVDFIGIERGKEVLIYFQGWGTEQFGYHPGSPWG